MRHTSLRARLIAIILLPLLVISSFAAAWQFRNASSRAEAIFDRGLLSAALAISRDVAVTGGDALSPATRALISDTSGGELFYHVYAPDGVFVTGYSTPPVAPPGSRQDLSEPLTYDAVYQTKPVRVLRFEDATTVGNLTGVFTITVWQDTQVRAGFVREVTARAGLVIVLLFLTVATVVWFGVGLGLRPLLDLEEAIAKRTPSELEPIRRHVPAEAEGIVSTLNSLLDRVSRRISSKDEFISNAAHQLRNPIAGVLALAEAVENAPTPEAARKRSAELVTAARDATHLTNQLLSFERAKGGEPLSQSEELNLGELIGAVAGRFRALPQGNGLNVQLIQPDAPCLIRGDSVMLQEALLNILTNAAIHGGPNVLEVQMTLRSAGGNAILTIRDDGIGIRAQDKPLALGRFSQANAGPGTGLGLPIAAQVMRNHDGHLEIESADKGTCIRITLPLIAGDNPAH